MGGVDVFAVSPNRGVPRTCDSILKKLAKQFEAEDGELPLAA